MKVKPDFGIFADVYGKGYEDTESCDDSCDINDFPSETKAQALAVSCLREAIARAIKKEPQYKKVLDRLRHQLPNTK